MRNHSSDYRHVSLEIDDSDFDIDHGSVNDHTSPVSSMELERPAFHASDSTTVQDSYNERMVASEKGKSFEF